MAVRRATGYRTLASLSRIRLLDALIERGPLTLPELASAAGLHENTIREHLDRLHAAGFISTWTEPIPRGRPRRLYSAQIEADDPRVVERIRLAAERGEAVRRLASPTGVAEALGSAASPDESLTKQLDAVEDHLDDCGFDSDVELEHQCIAMHSCPFESLAREHEEVCRVHYHLIKQTLQVITGPLEAGKLRAMEADGGCTVELSDRRSA